MIKDKLQIYIITYNRKFYLERTLNQILGNNSPIKDCDITILDNCSIDGTSELIEQYCLQFPNIKHIRHNINIGGNANIARAFEMASSCNKDYFWILCDDDKYDFSNWNEVEKYMNNNEDVICVANYAINYDKVHNVSLADTMLQLTFVPAGIYKTTLINQNVLMNMYQGLYTMFPQACCFMHAVNQNKKINVLDAPIVFNGLYCDDKCKFFSYARGTQQNEVIQRYKDMTWILGYSNVVSLLYNKTLQKEAVKCAILNSEVYGSWNAFYSAMFNKYADKFLYNYLFEIFKYLPITKTIIFLLKSIFWKITFKSLRIHNSKKKHKAKNIFDEQYWLNYFKKGSTSEYVKVILKKCKNKKVLLYGNGMVSRIFQNNYDLSNINIVGISDRKFLGCDIPNSIKYKVIAPNKIRTVDFDVIIIALKNWRDISKYLNSIGINKETYKLTK